MPILTLVTSTPLSPDAKASIARDLVAITAETLAKEPAVTVVSIDDGRSMHVGPAGSPGGGARDETGALFALSIRVTQGTNTKRQTAAFQAAAHAALVAALSAGTGPNYVSVDEVPAANWGFGGVTQEARAHGCS
ncbi:tautomerase family protein [Marivibrio halodurans]|uniref:Tautomerase family protein n=1 Tax=Marivibrio halodurans TaxID=2039722 RepID=A0A8J7S4S5_9PROT|nr:tautomerase family protein [Marivibrio halodurans]MBP5858779.1 tautomerase family protein [Marivibrio halodurans]